MAVYPGAIKRWLTVNKNRARLRPVRVNLHVAVSEASSLWGYFNNYSNPDSHFYVRRDGSAEQMVDTSLRAYADLHGNADTISIETQGGVRNTQSEPWTAAQVKTLASIFRWARQQHGIAGKLATDSRPGSSSHGLSWHRLGVDGNFPGGLLKGRVRGGILYSRARGKVCPGTAKIRQIPGILDLALGGTGGSALPAPAKPPKPVRDVVDIQLALAVLGHYDAGPGGKYLDGDYGAATVAAVVKYQTGKKSLAQDGDWGKATDRYFERNDMAKVLDQIGTAVWSTVHGSDTRNYGFIQRLTLREAKRATASQSGLLKAIEQITAGKPVDLDAIAAAAEEGATRAFVVGDLADALAEALAESLPEQEAERVADSVVTKIGERLTVEESA